MRYKCTETAATIDIHLDVITRILSDEINHLVRRYRNASDMARLARADLLPAPSQHHYSDAARLLREQLAEAQNALAWIHLVTEDEAENDAL